MSHEKASLWSGETQSSPVGGLRSPLVQTAYDGDHKVILTPEVNLPSKEDKKNTDLTRSLLERIDYLTRSNHRLLEKLAHLERLNDDSEIQILFLRHRNKELQETSKTLSRVSMDSLKYMETVRTDFERQARSVAAVKSWRSLVDKIRSKRMPIMSPTSSSPIPLVVALSSPSNDEATREV